MDVTEKQFTEKQFRTIARSIIEGNRASIDGDEQPLEAAAIAGFMEGLTILGDIKDAIVTLATDAGRSNLMDRHVAFCQASDAVDMALIKAMLGKLS